MVEESQITGTLAQLGQQLKALREAKRLNEEDVADMLRVQTAIIVDMENGHFEGRGVSVYVRGYFRAYAKYIGMPVEVVDNFLETHGFMQIPKKVAHKQFKCEKVAEKSNTFLWWFTGMILVGLFVLMIAWLSWQRNDINSSFLQIDKQQSQMIKAQKLKAANTLRSSTTLNSSNKLGQ